MIIHCIHYLNKISIFSPSVVFFSSQKLFNVLYLEKYHKPGGNSNVDPKVKGAEKKIHYTSKTPKYVHKRLYITFSTQNHNPSTMGKGIGFEFKK